METISAVLRRYWGYETFRSPQEEIIEAILNGKDVFAMLPTGAGKSICYQLPALFLPGVTFVISPLIALIEDQVQHLMEKKIPVGYLHSGMDKATANAQMDALHYGETKLFYISPERLQSEAFIDAIDGISIDFLAVDEAHCISQWGHDFRPSYRLIKEFKDRFPKIRTLALTASATPAVKMDIVEQLALKNPAIFDQTVVRKNLSYFVQYEEAKIPAVAAEHQETPESSIVYCGTRRRTVEAAEELKQLLHQPVYHYHAGMHRNEKTFAYQEWMKSSESIICATNAFGMGIDKPNVRSVVHLDLPSSLEQYYQEAGRAGRDGLPSRGIAFYNHSDIQRLLRLPDLQYPSIDFIRKVYPALMDFLRIGLEEGRELVRAFDIISFTKNFDLPLLPTISALRILEQEGYLIWSEDARTQYTAQLTTNRTNIDYIENNYKDLFIVLEALLRTYGSIFHFETAIQIFDLAKSVQLDKTIFEKRLYQLEELGILKYNPAIVGSFIVLLEDRVDVYYLSFNAKNLKTRKDEFIAKIEALIAYIENRNQCRNKLLAHYFGQSEDFEDCGKCDNCFRRKNFIKIDALMLQIVEAVKQRKSIKIEELNELFTAIPAYLLHQAIRKLIDNNTVKIQSNEIYI